MRTIARVIGLLGSTAVAVPLGLAGGIVPASAHGAMDSPVSRSYLCYQEGPERPTSEVCRAVVQAGGTQPLYDWMEVNIANAAGRHRELIPDGQLCSAGRAKYAGLDLARADWPTTAMPAGGSYEFTFRATAPHRGAFELFVTRDGYDPTRALRWSDLEPDPFLTATDPVLRDGSYHIEGELPAGKRGRHLIYTIWQRSDSPEAFYACSDVVFGDGGAYPGGPDPAPDPDPDPAPDPDPPADDSGSGEDDEPCHDTHGDVVGSAGAGLTSSAGADDQDAGTGGSGVTASAGSNESAHSGPHAAHQDLTAAAASTLPTTGGNAVQPALAGLTAAALGVALLLARPMNPGAHRRKPAHRRGASPGR